MMSSRILYFSFICFIIYTVGTNAKPHPNNHATCNAKDPSVQDCVAKAGQNMLKQAAIGFKEVGVPKLDPLTIPRMSLQNADGPVSLNLDLINGTHRGLSKSNIIGVHAEPDKYQFEVNMTIPEYNIKGEYNVSGKIIMLPIVGTGPSDITFNGVTVTWRFKGEPVVKNHKKYMTLTDFKVIMAPQGMHVQLDNLFNGNKQLGDTMNKFLNENWQEVFKQLQPGVEESFAILLMNFGNRALNKMAYTDMFPDMA